MGKRNDDAGITRVQRRLALLALVALLVGLAAPARAVDIVGQTTATLQWTPATGPVVGYGVFISRNGAAYPSTPDLTSLTATATVSAAYGDTLKVRVAAYDSTGRYGPNSPESDPLVFLSTAPASIVLGTTALSATTLQGASPASQSFTVRNGGGGTLSYSVSDDATWLSVSPASGTSTGETDTITVSFATGTLTAGSYSATITTSATGLVSKTIPVTLTVTPPAVPAMTLSTSALTASVQQGQNAAAQSFTIRNSGTGTLSYSLASNQSWLTVSPASGTSTGETDTISVGFASAGLAPGTYGATITASATGLAAKTIGVTLTVLAPPAMTLSTTSLSASAQQGASPAGQSFTIRNSGGGTLSYSLASNQTWLTLSPTSGTSTGETDSIAVSFATGGLAAGVYTATITASATGLASQTIGVTVTITAPPVMTLSTTALSASAQQGASPAGQSFTIRNAGGGILSYSLASNQTWLTLSPASGTSTGETDTIGVTFATSGLAVGTYSATITASATGLASQTIGVTLTVTAAPAPAMALSTTSLSASTQQGASPAGQSFTIRNSGTGTLSYSLASSQAWLTLSPTSGTSTGESDTIGVVFATTGLAVGTYSATITASATGLASQTIGVTLTVTALPAMALSTASLTASAQQGASPAGQSFTVRNSGGGTLSYSLTSSQSWLTLSPVSGTSTGETDSIGVTFATSALAAGSYTATITASATGVASQTISVSLTVTAPPAMALSTTALSASAQQGASPAGQSFTIRNSGGGTLSYSLASNQTWLTLSPSSGTSIGETDSIGVSFATSALAAGSYTATITASATGVASQTIAVSLTIAAAPAPAMALSTTALGASAQQGNNPANQSFTIQNSGTGTLSYSLASNQTWLMLSPASGTSTGESDPIGVSFATTGLAAGSYTATITASATGVPSRTITVSLTITAPPAMALSTTSLTASAQQGASPAGQSFTVRNSGGGTLSYSLASNQTWLTLSPASGTSTGESDSIGVSFATTGLAAGSYTATITASATGVASQSIGVTLSVTAPPAMALSTTSLTASAQQGASPAGQSFTVRNSGGGTLSYSLASNQTWLTLSPASGTSTGETDSIGVSFATTGLAAGSYTATITASATGVASQTIAVSLTVTAPPAPAMALSTTAMTASAPQGQNAAGQSITIRNSGTGTLSYSLASNQTWLTLSPASGTSTGETDAITVVFGTSGLAAGTYNATITASATGVASQTIGVTLTVTAPVGPAIGLSVSALNAGTAQGTDAAVQYFTIRNAGSSGTTLSYSFTDDASWLSLSPASGTSTGESDTISAVFSTASLAAGTYTATITASATGVSPQTIAVSLTVASGTPIVQASPASLSVSSVQGTNAMATSFSVRNAGSGTLSWSVADDQSWLSLSPASGTSTGAATTVVVSFDTALLAAGTYTALVTVSGTGVPGQTVSVTLTVGTPPPPPQPSLVLSATSVTASTPTGQNAASQSFTLRNGGTGTLSYMLSQSASWLSLTPTSGTSTGESDTITLTYATSSLAAGSYSTPITVSATGLPSQTVTVTLTVTAVASDWTVEAYGDFNGDGKTDVLWRRAASNENKIMFLNGLTVLGETTLPNNTSAWKPTAGDFDGDGKADLYWRNASTGEHQIWILTTGVYTRTQVLPAVNSFWVVGGVGDTDGDRVDDVVLRNTSTGAIQVWAMAAGNVARQVILPSLAVSWSIAAVGDFDGDGHADLAFRDPTSGAAMIWILRSSQFVRQETLTSIVSPWSVSGVVDLDGDGVKDLVLRNTSTQAVAAWAMSGGRFLREDVLPSAAADAGLVGLGDFDGDGKSDLLWRRQAAGENTLWRMSGATRLGTVVSTTGP